MTSIIVGDVGGTNVRFALVDSKPCGAIDLEHAQRYPVRDFKGFDDALGTYLDSLDIRPKQASFALAGPKFDDKIRMTNIDWVVSENEVENRFGFADVRISNDFVAMARGVAVIHDLQKEAGLEPILGGELNFSRPVCVLGPGTGMGVAATLPGKPLGVLGTEGGHTGFTPQTPLEMQVQTLWQKRLGFVSAETFLCGIGIFRLYTALCEIEKEVALYATQEEIVAAALVDRNTLAGRTLNLFCNMLGTFAANSALTLGASGGVVLAGGVSRHIAPFLDDSDFKARFLERGHGSWFVKDVPVQRLTARFAPLYGAAALLH